MTKKISKVYELSFHIIPTLSEKEVADMYAWVNETIGKKAKILSSEEPELGELAYTIRHFVRGEDGLFERFNTSYFASVKFEGEQSFIPTLGKTLREKESILRHIVLETVAEDTRLGELPEAEEEKVESSEASQKTTGVV